jgi:RHS repeat-associated protein
MLREIFHSQHPDRFRSWLRPFLLCHEPAKREKHFMATKTTSQIVSSVTYDAVGRLSTSTDKRGDVGTYSYNLDNTLSGISYALGSGSTAVLPPTLSYGYDTYYPRLTSAGGVGLTYYGPGVLGAGKPHVVTNTLTGGSAAITYTYDEWGRKVGANIDSASPQSVVLDSLGRVTNALNLLAPTTPGFAYSYYDPTHPTNRVGGISYPNGQSTSFSYFGSYNSFTSTGDENLKEIKNLTPASAVLSQDDYTRDAMGKILTWQQQTDSNAPLKWTEGYNAADQLTNASLINTESPSVPAVRSDSYSYDAAGNATTFNVSSLSRSPSYNALNQLTGSTPIGNRAVGFTGLLNEAATVTVNGNAASVSSSNHYFFDMVLLTPASTNSIATVPVVATDSGGNVRTNHYQTVVPAEPTYSPTFDNDGNELTNGAGQSYTWDVKNELTQITQGSNTYQFGYDALGHRISETDNGTLTKQWVWDGSKMAEERNASNVVQKRFFAQGEQISGTSYYYTRDHLGSIREMTNSSGAIVARYDYDPYGRTTLVQGSNLSDFQYAGMYAHQPSGLNLTRAGDGISTGRPYDPNTARWLSRDPLGEGADATLYSYVWNDPSNLVDPLGLAGGAGIGGAYFYPNHQPPPTPQPDPSQLLVASPGFRAGVGAAQMGKGFLGMFEGAGLCSTGPGALAGVPLMGLGLWGIFDGANNIRMSAAPPVNGGGGLPVFQPPAPAPAPTQAPAPRH